ncbi:hypothetical protein QBC47DRAFT_81628 [Echria macrotheca]|uniref:Uncharacterized protein n=1 Tax=Echria macrotheca TaxID=438768 RepID=A0AAJ0F1P0_9PEZI|nr:hypothetical protein QBC47DRAFT_81628 [Echria macrotheca]
MTTHMTRPGIVCCYGLSGFTCPLDIGHLASPSLYNGQHHRMASASTLPQRLLTKNPRGLGLDAVELREKGLASPQQDCKSPNSAPFYQTGINGGGTTTPSHRASLAGATAKGPPVKGTALERNGVPPSTLLLADSFFRQSWAPTAPSIGAEAPRIPCRRLANYSKPPPRSPTPQTRVTTGKVRERRPTGPFGAVLKTRGPAPPRPDSPSGDRDLGTIKTSQPSISPCVLVFKSETTTRASP